MNVEPKPQRDLVAWVRTIMYHEAGYKSQSIAFIEHPNTFCLG